MASDKHYVVSSDIKKIPESLYEQSLGKPLSNGGSENQYYQKSCYDTFHSYPNVDLAETANRSLQPSIDIHRSKYPVINPLAPAFTTINQESNNLFEESSQSPKLC